MPSQLSPGESVAKKLPRSPVPGDRGYLAYLRGRWPAPIHAGDAAVFARLSAHDQDLTRRSADGFDRDGFPQGSAWSEALIKTVFERVGRNDAV